MPSTWAGWGGRTGIGHDGASGAREYVQVAEGLDKLSWSLSALRWLRESLAAVPDGTSVG